MDKTTSPSSPDWTKRIPAFIKDHAADLVLFVALFFIAVVLYTLYDERSFLVTAFLVLAATISGRLSERLRAYLRRPSAADDKTRLSDTVKNLRDYSEKLESEKGRIESALNATIDPMVARMIIDQKLHNEKRPITVLFADLAGFTSIAETMPPETVITQLNGFYAAMEPVSPASEATSTSTSATGSWPSSEPPTPPRTIISSGFWPRWPCRSGWQSASRRGS